ncbi:MAG: tyrosine recombinase XerC [Rickettsiales bacterium]|nr:tyrosine recombinase XerC [Rickettsiales bacterium]
MRRKVEEFFRYLEVEKNYSRNTILSYRNDMEDFLRFTCDDLKKSMDTAVFENLELRDFRLWLTNRSSRGISGRSNARAMATIRSLYKFLERNCGIGNEIVFKIKSPRSPKSLPKNINHNNIIKMIHCVENFVKNDWEIRRDRALMVLMYSCGLRISEALSLSLNSFVDGNKIKILGKGQKERIILILPVVLEMLENYIGACPHDTGGDILFYGSRGKRYQPARFEKLIQNIRNVLGLPDNVTPHSLRHSFATELLANGADLRSIQELLGHSSLKTTQVYTHVDPSNILKVYNKTHPAGLAEAHLGKDDDL